MTTIQFPTECQVPLQKRSLQCCQYNRVIFLASMFSNSQCCHSFSRIHSSRMQGTKSHNWIGPLALLFQAETVKQVGSCSIFITFRLVTQRSLVQHAVLMNLNTWKQSIQFLFVTRSTPRPQTIFQNKYSTVVGEVLHSSYFKFCLGSCPYLECYIVLLNL